VLHLSTRWGFASIRGLALGSIKPPTPHDRLLLARTYSVDDWVVPALSSLCERTTPLSLSEARQMSIEDVVLVSTVREDLRGHALQVDLAEIPLRVEAEQVGALGLEVPVHLRFPKRDPSSSADLKRVRAHEGDDERSVSPSCHLFLESRSTMELTKLQAEEGAPENMSELKAEPARLVKNSQGEVAEARIVKTGKEASMTNNIGIQRGDPEEDNNGVPVGTSMLNSKPPATPANDELAGVPPVTSVPGSAASPVLASYPVGRGISLPFGQLLPKCCACSCNGLIAWSRRSNPKENGVLCLDHGLQPNSATRDLILYDQSGFRYNFISPEHEAAILELLS